MRILAFETSAKAASVALMEDGSLLAETYQNAGLTHSRTILSMAEHLLQSCDRTMEDVYKRQSLYNSQFDGTVA